MSTKRMIEIYDGDETYYGQIGTIESTSLGSLSHGIMSAYLSVRGDGWGISVGGYALDTPAKKDGEFSHREGTGYGLDHIMRLIETVGAETWEDCVGKNVIVLFNGSTGLGEMAVGIANISDEDKVMIFKDHADQWKSDHPGDGDL